MTMEEVQKTKIALIIEDRQLSEFIVLILVGEDFRVKTYSDQREALKDMEEDPPALIVSEFQTANINGIDFCKILRKNFLFQYTPVIFVLPDAAPLSKAKLFYAGADDYLNRADIENELVIKIKMNLLRSGRERDINPLTGLPGHNGLVRELDKRIAVKSMFAVSHADLGDFKLFNQRYGYERGDEVLKFTANSILAVLKDMGTPSDFLAHPYGDDFIFLTSIDSAEAVCEQIVKAFNEGICSFYDREDRLKGYVTIKNRKGEILKIPILKIHIGLVTNEHYPFVSSVQVIQICTELKDFARKCSDKSIYVKERRRKYPFF
jgi:PleD family two-component response regulator